MLGKKILIPKILRKKILFSKMLGLEIFGNNKNFISKNVSVKNFIF